VVSDESPPLVDKAKAMGLLDHKGDVSTHGYPTTTRHF